MFMVTSRALRLGNRMMEPTRDLGLLLEGLIVNRPADQEPHSQDNTTGVIDRSFICANTMTGNNAIGPYAAEVLGLQTSTQFALNPALALRCQVLVTLRPA
jgi:hypothetical protein